MGRKKNKKKKDYNLALFAKGQSGVCFLPICQLGWRIGLRVGTESRYDDEQFIIIFYFVF